MKKCVIFTLLLAWICVFLAGCTTPDSGSGSSNVSTPSLADPAGSALKQTDDGSGTLNSNAGSENTDAQSDFSDAPTEHVGDVVEDPEEESLSEIVIDGGNGFGVGGN